jgi:chloramphenicol 3-O phosphotransferase
MTARSARIILLHGASSAGKSTLARQIQRALDEPFLQLSSDHVALGLPERRDPDGPFLWWGHMRPRFFTGFHHSIVAYASAGNDHLIDHIIETAAWGVELRELLRPFDVFLVGVHCELGELERRERERGDRWIGEGRSHVVDDDVHGFGPYDLDIDTTGHDPAQLTAEVLRAWRARGSSRALDR